MNVLINYKELNKDIDTFNRVNGVYKDVLNENVSYDELFDYLTILFDEQEVIEIFNKTLGTHFEQIRPIEVDNKMYNAIKYKCDKVTYSADEISSLAKKKRLFVLETEDNINFFSINLNVAFSKNSIFYDEVINTLKNKGKELKKILLEEIKDEFDENFSRKK